MRRISAVFPLVFAVCFLFGCAKPKVARAPTPKIGDELPDYTPVGELAGELIENGSGSMDKIVVPTTSRFEEIYPHVDVELGFDSSAVVLRKLLNEEINLGAMSRPMEPDELAQFQREFGYPPLEIKVAIDAIEVLVHADNPVEGLTLPQLDAIFSTTRRRGAPENITRWGQLGLKGEWENLPIELYGGGKGWGTTRTFQQLVLQNGAFKNSVKVRDIMTGVDQEVGQNKAAIGYAVARSRATRVRAVPLAMNAGEPFVSSTPENIRNGKYPLTRHLYFYVNAGPTRAIEPVVREYLLFVLSKQGQKLIEQQGFVPLNAVQIVEERAKIARFARAEPSPTAKIRAAPRRRAPEPDEDFDEAEEESAKRVTIAGIVSDTGGNAAAGAAVVAFSIERRRPFGMITFGRILEKVTSESKSVADADGRFQIELAKGKHVLAALSADRNQMGLHAVSVTDDTPRVEIRLQKLVDVTVRIESSQPERFAHGRAAAAQHIRREQFVYHMDAKTDDEATFQLKKLLPGRYWISVTSEPSFDAARPRPPQMLLNQTVEVTEQTRELVLGGKFSGVIRGEVVGADAEMLHQMVHIVQKPSAEEQKLPPEERFARLWRRTATTDEDGRFEIFDVPQGEYALSFSGRTRDGDTLRASAEVAVGDSDEPVRVKLEVKRIVMIKSGQPAPDFELADPDGKPVKLSDFRGKFVFLDFWATWCGPCIAEIPHLKEMAKRFGRRDDFVLLSVSIDTEDEKWRAFIKNRQMHWQHALDKDGWRDGVAAKYGVTGIPATFLIGKDGVVVKTDLRGAFAVDEVARALGATSASNE
jgi:phosphate transport system substrate-binding protein